MPATTHQSPTQLSLVLARLGDFFAHRTPWHRRLWNIGTCLALCEVIEYADACLNRTVSKTDGLQFVARTAKREVARDPGTDPFAKSIARCLDVLDVDSTSKIDVSARDRLHELTRRVESEYLYNWSDTGIEPPVEYSARALASHLLDLGFSSDHLHRWITAVGPTLTNINELAGSARDMVSRMTARRYNVFVPCATRWGDSQDASGPIYWMDGQTAASWLHEELPNRERRRHAGGFRFDIVSLDPWAAVEEARAIIARADARIKVAQPSHDNIRLEGWARISGDARNYQIRPTPRQVEIGSLFRQGAVYRFDGGLPAETDDALELASYMESSSIGAAITGGWAAMEALLIRPGEGHHYQAADRLALLVACSVPRAELTPLAYRHIENSDDTLAVALRSIPTNFKKVELVESHLRKGNRLVLTNSSDLAAQNRLLNVIHDPATALNQIKIYVTESLRRLYNQRNLVSHSGSLRSRSLSVTARTALSLVGAGLDRIVHAQLETAGQLTPLSLVARAENELDLLGTPGGRSLSSLLE